MAGWIKLYRDITDHWIWQEKPFDKRSAWIDLILMANHKDNKFVFGNELAEVKRGSFITSVRKLCDKWGWSNTKVTSFLQILKNDNMIDFISDTKKTVITIANYGLYQDINDTETTQKHHENDTKTSQKHTNKNDKNVKNEKNLKTIMLCKEIIDYLNEKTGSSYKYNTNKNIELIQARLNEGFTLEDFKKVIDNKVADWGKEPKPNEKDMREYLRPITLFGTKFESYLNQKGGNTNGTTVSTNNAKVFKLDKSKLLANG
jgi:uncharacterized phage protein (TIGR02220 family)